MNTLVASPYAAPVDRERQVVNRNELAVFSLPVWAGALDEAFARNEVSGLDLVIQVIVAAEFRIRRALLARLTLESLLEFEVPRVAGLGESGPGFPKEGANVFDVRTTPFIGQCRVVKVCYTVAPVEIETASTDRGTVSVVEDILEHLPEDSVVHVEHRRIDSDGQSIEKDRQVFLDRLGSGFVQQTASYFARRERACHY